MPSGKWGSWESLEEADRQQQLIHLLSQHKGHMTLLSITLERHSLPCASHRTAAPIAGAQPEQLQDLQASCRNSKSHLAA